MSETTKTVAVIGGGVTGVTAAYALAKRGFCVTLYEKHRYAAMETSLANGGQLSACNAEVWTHFSTLLKGLKWMLKRDAPLLINPKPSWHKLSWLVEFVSNLPHYQRHTIETVRLALASRAILDTWVQAENIEFDREQRGILHIYRDKAGFEHGARVSKLLARGGLQRQPVTPEEMRAIEPALQGRFYGGYFTPSDSTGDIHKFSVALAAAAQRLGVTCLYGQTVQTISLEGRKAWVCAGEAGSRQRFDAVVICAGVASRALAAALGDRINIYPVKGYSITVELLDPASQAAAPRVSLLDDAAKLVGARLGTDRLRVAGTAEFNGFNKDIRADRIEPLVAWVAQCFPGVSTENTSPWAGLRPMTPSMLPRVGRGRAPCVFYNTGHGHLGWTLCAVTADMLANSVAENLTASA